MNLLFRKNASKKEKFFTIFWMVSIIACLYGFVSSISPSDLVRNNIVLISLVLALVHFIPVLLDRHPGNKVHGLAFPRRIFYYFILFLISYFVSFILVAYTIPSIFTSLVGQPYEFSSFVEQKRNSAKGCSHKIQLEGIGYGIHDHVCVESSFWDRTKPGDKVEVYSLRSILGIKVTALKNASKNVP